jgi:hypothetical protein
MVVLVGGAVSYERGTPVLHLCGLVEEGVCPSVPCRERESEGERARESETESERAREQEREKARARECERSRERVRERKSARVRERAREPT